MRLSGIESRSVWVDTIPLSNKAVAAADSPHKWPGNGPAVARRWPNGGPTMAQQCPRIVRAMAKSCPNNVRTAAGKCPGHVPMSEQLPGDVPRSSPAMSLETSSPFVVPQSLHANSPWLSSARVRSSTEDSPRSRTHSLDRHQTRYHIYTTFDIL